MIHIPRTDAPKVIARFGNVANLVTQVLEPTIGNYFRNAAQGSDVIDFLKSRQQKQDHAKQAIAAALEDYNVGAVDTLIGDIVPPDDLMKTLTDRKIAEQQEITFGTQKTAEVARKELEQARAIATTQARVVDAERSVQIADFNAQATVKAAEGGAQAKRVNAEADAMVKKVNADADAMVTATVGAAEAGKIRAVGTAEADVIKQKIASMESGNYASIEVAKALAASGQRLVPEILASGDGAGGGSGSLVNVLLAQLVASGAARGRGEAPAER
ncbi:MAG: SPFH domain-containing protein [Vicinamibacteria bacterium]